MFSVINAVLVEPLSYENPDRVVRLYEQRTSRPGLFNTSYPDMMDVRDQTETLAQVANVQSWRPLGSIAGEPTRIVGENVSANLFDLLGVRPAPKIIS